MARYHVVHVRPRYTTPGYSIDTACSSSLISTHLASTRCGTARATRGWLQACNFSSSRTRLQC